MLLRFLPWMFLVILCMVVISILVFASNLAVSHFWWVQMMIFFLAKRCVSQAQCRTSAITSAQTWGGHRHPLKRSRPATRANARAAAQPNIALHLRVHADRARPHRHRVFWPTAKSLRTCAVSERNDLRLLQSRQASPSHLCLRVQGTVVSLVSSGMVQSDPVHLVVPVAGECRRGEWDSRVWCPRQLSAVEPPVVENTRKNTLVRCFSADAGRSSLQRKSPSSKDPSN